jgi:transposase
MEVVYSRCCGLDLHKRTVVACLLTPGPRAKPVKEVRTFGTMTDDLLALADWLTAAGCTHVAMESTGVLWKPIVRHEALLNREGEKGPLQRTVAASR